MARILIVGAGDVGGRLAVTLAAQGHQVWALRRSLPERRQALPGVHCLVADVTQPDTLTVLPEQLDIVVTALSPGESGVAAYRRVYVEGTRQLMQALSGQALVHHFWVSSTSVYGQSQGEWVDADTPAQPGTDTAHALLAAEAVAQSAGWPCSIVRFGGLYGPGRHWLLRWVSSGRPVQQHPPSWSNRIHVEDAAGFLAHLVMLALTGQPLRAIYIGVDDAPTPQHEVLVWLAAQLGCPPPTIANQPDASLGKRLSNRSLRDSGYVLRYPDFRTGYVQVLSAREGQ